MIVLGCKLFRGVPQAPIPGSLTFHDYINGLNKCTILSAVHYCDDSTVYIIEDLFDSFIFKTIFGLVSIDN